MLTLKNMTFTRAFTKSVCVFSAALITLTVLSSSLASAASKTSTNTLSLQNLERERAALIEDILSPTLDLQQRQAQLKKRQRQLTDMERMVMRDERLMSSSSMFVQKAFNEYELTFLVHAGAEKKQSASEHWLNEVNITTDAVLNTSMSFRK